MSKFKHSNSSSPASVRTARLTGESPKKPNTKPNKKSPEKTAQLQIASPDHSDKITPGSQLSSRLSATLLKFRRQFRRKALRWLDEWRLAGSGLVLSSKKPLFLRSLLITTLVFGFILQFFSAGIANLDLFNASDWDGRFNLIIRTFLHFFGIDQAFLDWALIFCLSLLQGILIGMLVQLYHEKKLHRTNTDSIIGHAQNAGIITGLALLGAGCPACGTTLIAPILGVFFSGGYAIAGRIAGWLTAICVVIAFFSLKKLGLELYAIIITNKRKG